MIARFSLPFTAMSEHIDRMGHVNNAVWVQWMEVLATAHWEAVAPREHQARYAWVVARHEIDYRGNIRAGERVIGETFIPAGPSGARFERHVQFHDAKGRTIVSARTIWAMVDMTTGRLMRVPPEVAAPFISENP